MTNSNESNGSHERDKKENDADNVFVIKRTSFHALHQEMGAHMVPFAGYDMPLYYRDGIVQEHLHTRSKAGIFDVSHMGRAWIVGGNDSSILFEDIAQGLENIVPGDIKSLSPGQMKYSLLLNERGGILDDVIITRGPEGREEDAFIVINAASKDHNFSYIAEFLPKGAQLIIQDDSYALVALQGPQACAVLEPHVPKNVLELPFMHSVFATIGSLPCFITRSGYTGEDGFEISVHEDHATSLVGLLLQNDDLWWIGLGARDSLRLEAGFCLYGHDIDETTTPVESCLTWTIGKRRRVERNFKGADVILDQLENGAAKKRVGILMNDMIPAREGAGIVHTQEPRMIGSVTSGSFSPTLQKAIGMGYVESKTSSIGSKISVIVRGTSREALIVALPFVEKKSLSKR